MDQLLESAFSVFSDCDPEEKQKGKAGIMPAELIKCSKPTQVIWRKTQGRRENSSFFKCRKISCWAQDCTRFLLVPGLQMRQLLCLIHGTEALTIPSLERASSSLLCSDNWRRPRGTCNALVMDITFYSEESWVNLDVVDEPIWLLIKKAHSVLISFSGKLSSSF